MTDHRLDHRLLAQLRARLSVEGADVHVEVAWYLRALSRRVRLPDDMLSTRRPSRATADFVSYRLARWAIAVERQDLPVLAEALVTAKAAARADDYGFALEAYEGAASVLRELVPYESLTC